jgi:hypothetical protein
MTHGKWSETHKGAGGAAGDDVGGEKNAGDDINILAIN